MKKSEKAQPQTVDNKTGKFNDRDVYRLQVEKIIVKRGQEFIDFEIKSINQTLI